MIQRLTQEDLDHQIINASDFCARGGDMERWFASKGFNRIDEAKLRIALGCYTDTDILLVEQSEKTRKEK